MGVALPPPHLSKQHVALGTQSRQISLDWPHPFTNVTDAALQLGSLEPAQIFGHTLTLQGRLLAGPA